MTEKSDIIKKIRNAKLTGRGGGCFFTADKWEMVKGAGGNEKYVVCNASEGEPLVAKDFYILKNHPDVMVEGMKIALEFLEAKQGFIYLNPSYFRRLENILKKAVSGLPIELFCKPPRAGYIGGEETSLLNTLEKKRTEPRLRPPYPPDYGLWGRPTLINNVETFYFAAKIKAGEYFGARFFCVDGDCLNGGVFELSENLSIKDILKKTGNYPDYDFFVQAGGGASGILLNQKQLDQKVAGSGSIVVYSYLKHEPLRLIKGWLEFFKRESCGQCTPCREGTYRLCEIISRKKIDWKLFFAILGNMAETSFCGLGCSAVIPIRSFAENIMPSYPDDLIASSGIDKKLICDCFK